MSMIEFNPILNGDFDRWKWPELHGLTQKAQDFLNEPVALYVETGNRVYPDGRIEPFERIFGDKSLKVKMEETPESVRFSCRGMYDSRIGQEYDLSQYFLKKYTRRDGSVFFEKLQEPQWNGEKLKTIDDTRKFETSRLVLADEAGNIVPESLHPEDGIGEGSVLITSSLYKVKF